MAPMRHLKAVLAAAASMALLCAPATAQLGPGDPGDPRSYGAIALPELGTMTGVITRQAKLGHREEYGRAVFAVGDVNNDGLADWCVEHRRSDTAYVYDDGYWGIPVETLLYLGQRGRLPDVRSAQRIGPTELGSETHFLAAGDFDADGHRDIVCSIRLLGDTSGGGWDYDLRRVVVFWGKPSGRFEVADTTQLANPSSIWIGVYAAFGVDVNRDGIDDLFLFGRSSMRAGVFIRTAALHVWTGGRGRRWGRGDVRRTPVWQWWTPPGFNLLKAIDQDGDG